MQKNCSIFSYCSSFIAIIMEITPRQLTAAFSELLCIRGRLFKFWTVRHLKSDLDHKYNWKTECPAQLCEMKWDISPEEDWSLQRSNLTLMRRHICRLGLFCARQSTHPWFPQASSSQGTELQAPLKQQTQKV